MLNRRTFSVYGVAASLGAPAIAQADALRIVVGFPAGGIVDVIARELGEALKPHLGGRAIVVEAKPGSRRPHWRFYCQSSARRWQYLVAHAIIHHDALPACV